MPIHNTHSYSNETGTVFAIAICAVHDSHYAN